MSIFTLFLSLKATNDTAEALVNLSGTLGRFAAREALRRAQAPPIMVSPGVQWRPLKLSSE